MIWWKIFIVQAIVVFFIMRVVWKNSTDWLTRCMYARQLMIHVWNQHQVVRGSLLVGVFITFRFGKAKRRTKCITSKALPLVPAVLKGLDIRKLSDGVCRDLQRAIGQQSLCRLSLILVLLVAGKQFFWGE